MYCMGERNPLFPLHSIFRTLQAVVLLFRDKTALVKVSVHQLRGARLKSGKRVSMDEELSRAQLWLFSFLNFEIR